MTQAMNSAAAALQAMNEKDDKIFKHKFDVWKIDNANALKLFDYQQDAYDKILNNKGAKVEDKLADLRTMRRGLTFVLDTDANDWKDSHGNEAKMQKIWQCMPLRSQRIFILGANVIKRVLINAALAIASLFTKEKVLRRIKFAELDEVKKEITEENLPIYKGGKNAGVTQDDALLKHLSDRLASFPKLPDDI